MLEDADTEGFEGIVAWDPDGKPFAIKDVEAFQNKTLPKYFHQVKYKSFQRRLNNYTFRMVPYGPAMGSYYHPFFIRGRPDLQENIIRKTNKKTTKEQ
mmetsp:Transcript_89454/g.258033  ORF Transcript_89454/g.258033 Transcript_89454/m.258033 type:complete len:98 (-) Transcript_89454:1334-1627(-)